MTLKWVRLKELLVTTLVGWIPKLLLGDVLRSLLYRTILGGLGRSVYIQEGVELSGASCIEIGDEAHIFRGVRISAQGQNNWVYIGAGASLQPGVDIGSFDNTRIEIGEGTYIGPYTCFSGPGHIKVGKDCLVAAHTGIVANNHKFTDLEQAIRHQGVTREGVVIEDNCWLGYKVSVLDGVTIGQGSVIGAGAVVTKDIPPYSVAIGVPARVVASRSPTKLGNLIENEKSTSEGDNCIPIALSNLFAEIEKAIEPMRQCFIVNDTKHSYPCLANHLRAPLSTIRQAMTVDTITILLKAQDKEQLSVISTLGLEQEISEGIRIPVGRGFAGRIAASHEPMIIDDLSTVEVVSPVLRNRGVRSMLGVPLLVKDQVIGVFHIGTLHPHQFTKKDIHLLQLIADRLEVAMEPLLELQTS